MLGAALDSVCGYAASTLMPADVGVLSIEYKTNFVAPARGQRFRMVGTVVRVHGPVPTGCASFWSTWNCPRGSSRVSGGELALALDEGQLAESQDAFPESSGGAYGVVLLEQLYAQTRAIPSLKTWVDTPRFVASIDSWELLADEILTYSTAVALPLVQAGVLTTQPVLGVE
jgi:Thioesterase superfamily